MTDTVSKEPIAIIGLGCVLPDAPDVEAFWDNLLAGKDSVREVDPARWDPTLFYDADRKAANKTYTKIGAFVHDDNFNGIDFRMPPTVVEQIDPSQRWALSATRQAFIDAGLTTGLRGDEGKDFDRSRCAVILGNAMGGEQMKLQTKVLYWPQIDAALRDDPGFQSLPVDAQEGMLQRAKERFEAGVPPITEDSMPGTLSNVAAGRIANAFDLQGKNFTTDAACASSIAALDAAVDALRDDECDLAVCGGTDRSMDVTPYVEFSKIGALSPDGSRPFDKAANGFVMGEGCAIFILKRLSDAERDGDRIHAVVRGIGGSSDGKGKGITAPNPVGQVRAVQRAYEEAQCDPFTIGYLEAHGTSTPVGDPVELTSVVDAFGNISDTQVGPGSIKVGSVKSNMGHLKSAAGAAGLLKAALTLREGVIPPSINVHELNPRIDWAKSPFSVATEQAEWPQPEGHPRRAAVSSFGFGGTNFHVVMEQYVPGALKRATPTAAADPAATPTAATPAPTDLEATPMTETTRFDQQAFATHMQEGGAMLESQALVLDADSLPGSVLDLPDITFPQDGQKPRIRDIFRPLTERGVDAQRRVGLAVNSTDEIPKKLELAQKAAANPAVARLAFQQGVFINEGEPQGKVAFLFPGQGTQYVNMGRDLSRKYAIVRNTFEEADDILFDELGGVKLTDILWPDPDNDDNRTASNDKLKLTEFTQPAVLAMDVAILRLVRQWGIRPDVVAGHSLGEYGALVAAGVLSFADALHAVAARGREMANVDLPDLGKMASIPADWETVSQALEQVDGYVICANKNCPSQTVIAGSSSGVDQAVELLTKQGLQCMYLPVSAAFHSDIVAPASEPLRKVLGRLDVQPPKVRALSNVGAAPYPDDPEAIRDNLAVQVASPVEWIGIVERMVDEGVTTFVEIGPKKALTGFCMDILQDRMGTPGGPVAICSNHPKKGEIQHVNELFAFLGAWGFRPQLPDLNDAAMYTASFRDPTAAFATRAAGVPGAAPAPTPRDPRIDVIADALAGLSQQLAALKGEAMPSSTSADATPSPTGNVHGGPAATAPHTSDHSGEPSPASASGASSSQAKSGPAPGVPSKATQTPPAGAAPVMPADDEDKALAQRVKAFGIDLDDIGISGISVGLPGADKPLFDDGDWDRILRGDNLIDALPDSEKDKLAGKNIVRLVKGSDGQASFQIINDVAQVIQLAGRRGDFDISDWGVQDDLAGTLDRTFQYAIAAGLEALHDAGIPLQRTYLKTTTGSYLPKEWKLPEPLRDETGIIFASAFPGYDNLIQDISRYLADKYAGRTLDELQSLYQELLGAIDDADLKDRLSDWFEDEFARLQDVLPDHGAKRYEFNRKFLFNVLSLGHAQLAQFIGARGPNTQINAACASTTQAVAIAEDWIRTGRCRRVVVVGADDVTSDTMFEWIGAGFLASGAATTKRDVKDAALPFDARRHGMIVGMGAAGLIVEAMPETEARGMRPIAKLLATEVANSAYHGSRLDVGHISQCMRTIAAKAQARYGVDAQAVAKQTVFVSHETYTPARGGSASAEIHALRDTFGDHANEVVIANTKGFTGHPQGAGVEDTIALKMLQRGQVPPIANFRDPDPELGDLNLSKGGAYDVRYALRLAAGFGSQVAMTMTELVAREDERVADADLHRQWLSQVSGLPDAETEVVHRTLRIVDQGAPQQAATTVEGAAQPTTSPPSPAPPVPVPHPHTGANIDEDAALAKVTALVAEKTGYPDDMLDPDLDMEADLGIDTVKQAELFGELREHFGVPLRDDLQIADYNTLRKVAGYMAGGSGGTPLPAGTSEASAELVPEADASQGPATPEATETTPTGDEDAALAKVTSMVADKTGYPADMLEPDLDMEADLGIDTVKQAELFGELREQFGVPLREDLQIADYNTLRKVAGYMAGGSGGTPLPASTSEASAELVPEADASQGPTTAEASTGQTPPTAETDETTAPATRPDAASTATSAGDEKAALAKVTEVIAQKTGYPADMLEPDLDMEADLGIDTVKQAELFGELREFFGVPMREDLQIADYNTLRKVAGYMAGGSGGTPLPASTSEASAELVPEADASQGPAAAEATEIKPTGSAGATANTAQHAPIIRRVPHARAEPSPGTDNDVRKGALVTVGDDDRAVLEAFTEAGFSPSFEAQEPVGLLCIATDPAGHPKERATTLFDVAKANRDRFGRGTSITIVTRQDGAHGTHEVRDASMAAVAGLGKALRKEFPDALVKVIDLHPDADASVVVDEVLHGGDRTEICFDGEARRHVIDVAPQPLADATPDVADQHIVVSGGAQGITVEILAALAPQHPKLTLLGRTVVPEEATTWAAWDDARWKEEEQATIAAMKDAGDKVTPVALQERMAPMRKAAEVQRNLERLSDLGAEVAYMPVDVRDADGVAEAIDRARGQYGPVAGILHAAGTEISKDIASKPIDQFDVVFSIKHDGLHALLDATKDDDVQWLASFGSVAGRFGNIGQTDYSAVNDYLCKAVQQEAQERSIPTAFTIAWGPWGEVGMATKGSIMQIMEASGVTPIPTAAGVEHFLRELATPGHRESVVAGTLGAIDVDKQVVDTPYDPETDRLQHLLDDRSRFRLLERIEAMTDTAATASLVMDQARHPYAHDHAIDGVPYLPGVFGLESFAETCSLLAGDLVCTKIEDARFSIPVKQLRDQPVTTRIEVERVSAEEEADMVFDCRMTSRMVGPDGVERGEPRVHFAATLTFTEAPEPLTTEGVPPCTRELGKERIYPPFFHGPSFQVMRYAGPMEAEESVGAGALPYAAAFAEGDAVFQVQPLLVEALFQLCGLRTMEVEGKMSLPAAIESLELLDHEPSRGEVRLWCRPTGEDDGMRRFDAVACTPDGEVILRMTGFGMVETGPAPTVEARPDQEETQPTGASAARQHVQTTLADEVPIPLADVGLPELDDAVFAAVNVADADADPTWFTTAEMEVLEGLTVDKRAAEWRAGRLAAKAAVMAAAPTVELRASEIEITNADSGAPQVTVKGQPIDGTLSITHRDGLAIACVSEGPVGIDLETVEERSNGFQEEAFNADERPLTGTPAGATCVWAAKEATFKRIGTGLKQALHAWTVRPDGEGGATCEGPDGSFGVRFYEIEERVLAVSMPGFDVQTEAPANA